MVNLERFYYKKNRLQQLKGFYYTALLGSLTKAAEKMFISQAAISMQISSLEKDLKIILFERKNNKLILTQDGKTLYNIATPHLQAIDEIIKKFYTEKKLIKNNLVRIAANHVSISYILPNYIKKLKEKYPNIEITISNISKKEALDRLINDKVDVIIYPFEKNEIPIELKFLPINKYQPSLVIRKDHPLAKKHHLSLSDVAKYELVRIDPNLITLPGFEEIVTAHNLKSKIIFENSDWEILKQFVLAGIGVAIISDICIDKNHDQLIAMPLTNYFPKMSYGVSFKKVLQVNKNLEYLINILTKKVSL